ncbi:MAG: hypothetical protein Q7K45_05115 [Nanoarchaeota archaeon]|nr:hypothetical protein [Nanoarchaeota archaeon]
MKVKELKKIIADLPDDLELYLWDDEWSSFDDGFDLSLGIGTRVTKFIGYENDKREYKEIIRFVDDVKNCHGEDIVLSTYSCDWVIEEHKKEGKEIEEIRIGVF